MRLIWQLCKYKPIGHLPVLSWWESLLALHGFMQAHKDNQEKEDGEEIGNKMTDQWWYEMNHTKQNCDKSITTTCNTEQGKNVNANT